jgi:transcriptional regulator with XRE-family HTH domain
MTIRETIAANLRSLRKHAGLKQHQVAKKVFVSEKSYQNYEYAKATPSIDVLWRLAQLYDISVDDFCVKYGESSPTTY